MSGEETTQVGNSDSSGDSQSSGESQQSAVDLTALQKRLDQMEAQFRGIQKGTDKVNARTEKRAEVASNARIERITELAKAGKTPAEIQRELLLDDLLTSQQDPAPVTQIPRQEKRDEEMDEDSKIINRAVQALKLDPNDATVAAAISKQDFGAIINLAVSKSTIPDADATIQPPITSKEKSGPDANQAALQAAYDKELADLVKANSGRRVPPGALAQLKLKHKQKGLKIH